MTSQTVRSQFEALVRESKVTLKHSTAQVLAYTESRTAHVQAHAGDPGFDEMVATEIRNVAQFAGIEATDAADAGDANARGKVFGFLLAMLAGA